MLRLWKVAFRLAWRLSFSTFSSSSYIFRIAFVTLAVSMATMMITTSLTEGFKTVVSNKLYQIWGSHRVVATTMANESVGEYYGLDYNAQLEQRLKQNHFQYDRFSSVFTIMQLPNNEMEGMMLKSFEQVNRWKAFLVEGESIDTTKYAVYISRSIARKYKVKFGESIWIHFLTATGGSRVRKMKIAGIYHTGVSEYDKKVLHCHANVLRRLGYKGIGGYEIFAHNITPSEKSKLQSIFFKMPWEWTGLSIEKIIPDLFDWINYASSTEWIFVVILSILILANLIVTFMLFVVDRSRMLGILLALGYKSNMIYRIVFLSGFISNAIAIIMGLGLAIGFLYGQDKFHWITLNEEVHYLKFATVQIDYGIWAIIIGLMFLVSTLSLIFPARLATKFKVTKVLRFS